MIRSTVAIVLALGPAGVAAQSGQGPSVPAILAEFNRLADHVVWPGFHARDVPIAIYDGESTWLVRHPNPPAGFHPEPGAAGVTRMAGRHDAMRANTSTDVGGVRTATVIIEPSRSTVPARYAAVLIHEAFHVFQRERHPTWGGNEVELFTYPMDDEVVLALRKLETESLRRAVTASDSEEASCWAGRALANRRARFARLSDGAAQYERGTELLEGLADYVEFRATGGNPGNLLSENGFAADAVRQRSYAVGTALAVLLDRFAPYWTSDLERGDEASLDGLLEAALSTRTLERCEHLELDLRGAREWAQGARADLLARRSAVRNRISTQPGFRVIVEAGASAPLFPQNFDPWNVLVVGATEVVHTRWIELGSEAGSLEVLNRDVLTEGVGPHPLFNGVARVIVAGLDAEPEVSRDGDVVVLQGTGLTARFAEAAVRRSESSLTISLP